MLALYQKVAGLLVRFRTVLWIGLFASVCVFGWAVLKPTGSGADTLLLASTAITGWFLCLLVIQYYFIELPEPPAAEDRLFTRVKKRLGIFLSWCLALLMTGLTFAVLMFSARAIGLIIRELSV